MNLRSRDERKYNARFVQGGCKLLILKIRKKSCRGRQPSWLNIVLSIRAHGMALAAILTVTCLVVLPAEARDIICVYENGRWVFIHTGEDELRLAGVSRGTKTTLQLIERHKRSLPGLGQHIETFSRKYGIEPELVYAMIEVESAWNPRARSPKGAVGLMQLLPETVARFGVQNPFGPRENVFGGIRYLRFLLDRFGGDLRFALAAYNAGEAAVETSGGVPPYPETRTYVERVKSLYEKLVENRSPSSGHIPRTVEQNGQITFVNY